MKTYKLYKEQRINASLSEVWDFFSSPKNLNQMTPSDMSFKIISTEPLEEMYEGQEIEYKVSPVLNIPLYWKTLISEVEPKRYFIDVQLKGPYKLWKHKHTFIEENGSVKMIDELEYALPFGILGEIAQRFYIKNKLDEIFNFRYNKVDQLFNNKLKRIDNLTEAITL